MTDFVERMKAERDELFERIRKLNAFIGTETFSGLGELERVLLTEQLAAMDTYDRLLLRRMALHAV